MTTSDSFLALAPEYIVEASVSLNLCPGNAALLEIRKTEDRGILGFVAPFMVGNELGGGDGTF